MNDQPKAAAALGRVPRIILGALIGLALAWMLPSSWIFTEGQLADTGHQAGHGGVRYACPMFCVILDEPPADGRCPVCGMTLGPLSATQTLDEHEQWMVGLEAAPLTRLPLARELQLVGEVDYDERRLSVVSARTAGWVEVLTHKVTWEAVSAGEVLLELYGPELLRAQEELLVARGVGGAVLDAAREKLSLLGVDAQEISSIEESGKAQRRLPLRAPRSGLIVRRQAVEGAYVGAGRELFAIADLDVVWLQMEAFESELPWLEVGTVLQLQGATAGSESFEGRVMFIDPVVDRASRTVRVRIEVDNPLGTNGKRRLIPGQRIEAAALIPLDKKGLPVARGEEARPVLALPRSALLRTGKRSVVYVLFADEVDPLGGEVRNYELDSRKLPPSVGYELVELRVGPLARHISADQITMEGGELYYPVLGVVKKAARIDPNTGADLSEMALTRLRYGHVVATKGALLLDSQAQLAGRSSLLYPGGRSGDSTDPHAGH